MMDLNTYLQRTFADLANKLPGFISVAVIDNNGTIIASYPPEMKRELELTSPFHLQVYNQATKSLGVGTGDDVVKEILITTEKKLYILESRTQRAVGVLTLDENKANLGLARRFSEDITDEAFKFFKESGFYQ